VKPDEGQASTFHQARVTARDKVRSVHRVSNAVREHLVVIFAIYPRLTQGQPLGILAGAVTVQRAYCEVR
jgi:hypothetical protein